MRDRIFWRYITIDNRHNSRQVGIHHRYVGINELFDQSKTEFVEIKLIVVNRSPGFSSKFKEDKNWWFRQDFQKVSKILDLVTAVMQEPFEGIGKPEPLKYMDADIWSRRIDLEHWLVYRVGNTQIDFLAWRYHYE